VEAALVAEGPLGDVLELACGTGLWTRHLVPRAARVTAVDASLESLARNRERLRPGRVDYLCADLFEWRPPRDFDFVMFGFWLSHVPAARFDAFWSLVRDVLRPGGKVFFVDSLLQPESTAKDHAPITPAGTVRRKLNDGREFDIVKIFYEPRSLRERLALLGWDGYVRATADFFIYGCLERAA
jgi:demethylmenaquinone methyltransferase/2-methoxy-6-polyprenyl-1,4-benzoquinol methylase